MLNADRPTLTAIEVTLRHYVTNDLLVDDDLPITPATPLFEGILDSLGTIKLVSFVEDKYRINVADGDLCPEYFASIERVAAYVAQKMNRLSS